MILLHRLAAHHFKQLRDIELRLPDSGSVLIEGHNEAGKSSLFEAVFFALFGRPLLGERDYAIADLKRYGAESMEVALDFSIAGRAFSIARSYGKVHRAKLIAPGENGEETISGLNEIRKRLSDEMRLSADALLNTCFVEQKRLERLEDMNREARRDAINELLNLKVLTDLEAHFKITREKRDELERQKQRVALAKLDAQLPQLELAVAQAEYSLRAARRRETKARINELKEKIESAQQEQKEISAQREQAAKELAASAEIEKRLQQLDGDLLWRAKAWRDAQSDREKLQEQLQDLQSRAEKLHILENRWDEQQRVARIYIDLERTSRDTESIASFLRQREHFQERRLSFTDINQTEVEMRHVKKQGVVLCGLWGSVFFLAALLSIVGRSTLSISLLIIVSLIGIALFFLWRRRWQEVERQYDEVKQQRAALEVEERILNQQKPAAFQGNLEDEIASWKQTQQAAESRLEEFRSLLQLHELPLEADALQTEIALRKDALERERQAVARLEVLSREAEQKAEKVKRAREEFLSSRSPLFESDEIPRAPAIALEQLQLQRAVLVKQLENFDRASFQAQLDELQEESSALDRTIAAWQHEQQTYSRLLDSSQQSDDSDHHREQKSVDECEQALRLAQETLIHHRAERRAAAQMLSLGEEVLDLSAEEEKLSHLQSEITVKRRATEIVSKTRADIVSRVMPLTIANVRRVLPLLTEGRYRDVQWDEETNALAVYDSLAHNFVRKRVFSGGARDQISLALRLAFALATLPGEHNIRPAFLFLDEPLSSFDYARTQALVELLTRGLIRQSFQQIFLISHSRSFESALFDYRLRMEAGRVVESTLP